MSAGRLLIRSFPNSLVSSHKRMKEIASDKVMQQAYEWLCDRREEYAANKEWKSTQTRHIIGRISRGFYFLGYSFSPAGLTIAPPAMECFVERATRLCEQGADQARIGTHAPCAYARGWARAGVPLSY